VRRKRFLRRTPREHGRRDLDDAPAFGLRAATGMNRFFSGPAAARRRSLAAMSMLLVVALWPRGAAAQTAAPAPTTPRLENPPVAAPPLYVTPSLPGDSAFHDVELDKQLAESRANRGAKRMEIAGIILSLIGAGGTLAGSLMAVTVEKRGDFGGFAAIPGVIMAGTSVTLLATGIPLWIVGACRSPQSVFAAAPASLRVGLTGMGVGVGGSF
jgi:hypothetical protein